MGRGVGKESACPSAGASARADRRAGISSVRFVSDERLASGGYRANAGHQHSARVPHQAPRLSTLEKRGPPIGEPNGTAHGFADGVTTYAILIGRLAALFSGCERRVRFRPLSQGLA